jgi:DNA primase
MNFPSGFLDEIRERLAVSDVVGRRVQLKKRGREWIGLSPFNPEKSPSFTVNDQKGFYHCFSSGNHGDIFTFVMETDGLSFPEAVERLAGEAGVAMPQRTAEAERREAQRKSLIDVMDLAAAYFEDKLQSPEGAAARGYLVDRGLSTKTQQEFRMGFAPADRRALKTHLAGHDVTVEQMVAAGLVIAGEDIAVSYDRFRERIMFPIGDSKGRVIAFGGRALSADAQAKYLNSPETELFHKGHVLYNYARARRAAHDAGSLIVVEGYMDVIALSAAGFDHAVAPLGTALTADQMKLLWRMVPEPTLCLDGDKAGLKAAYRSIETALPMIKPGHSLRYALLPDGQDPDDLIRNQGGEAMTSVLAAARPLAEMLWLRETEGRDLTTPERRADLESRFDAALGEISDEKVRRHYSSYFRDKLTALWSAGKRRGKGADRGRFKPRDNRRDYSGGKPRRYEPSVSQSLKRSALAHGAVSGVPNDDAVRRRESVLLLTVVNHPFLLERYSEEFSEVEFSTRELDRLRKEILHIAALHAPLDNGLLESQLMERGQLQSVRQVSAGLTLTSEWFMERDAAPSDAETGWRQTLSLHRKSFTLQKELNAAERVLAQEPSEENLAHLNDIREQIRSAVGEEATIEGFGEASGKVSGTVR